MLQADVMIYNITPQGLVDLNKVTITPALQSLRAYEPVRAVPRLVLALASFLRTWVMVEL